MRTFIQIVLVMMLAYPTSSVSRKPEMNIKAKSIFVNNDYHKYDDLVKKYPSAKRLVDANKILDKQGQKLDSE